MSLLNVSPLGTMYDPARLSLRNTEQFSNGSRADPFIGKVSNFSYIILCELCCIVGFASFARKLRTALTHHILHVIELCAGSQMLWPYTPWCIAFMQDRCTFRNLTVGQFIANPMCSPRSTFPQNIAISVFGRRTCPEPAVTSLIDVAPKSGDRINASPWGTKLMAIFAILGTEASSRVRQGAKEATAILARIFIRGTMIPHIEPPFDVQCLGRVQPFRGFVMPQIILLPSSLAIQMARFKPKMFEGEKAT